MSADGFDQELVAAFLGVVRGRSMTDIAREVPGVTKNDVSRWRNDDFKRLTDEKRTALLRYLTQQDDDGPADGSISQMMGPLLAISRATAELAEIVARGLTPQDRAAQVEVERRLRALAAARRSEKSA